MARKRPHTEIVNCSFTKEQRQYKGAKVIFSTNGVETTGHPLAKKMNLDTDLTGFTKNNSKWGTDLNMTPKIITPLKDNMREN